MTFPFRFPRVARGLVALLGFAGLLAPAWAQFETRATQLFPGESFGLAVGDFNRDGILDVAVPAGNCLCIYLGNGDGTFRLFVSYPGVFDTIAVADFNNDGNLDVVVGPDSQVVEVFLGNGDGTFQPPLSSPVTGGAGFIAVGDFNGDRKMDIAIIDEPYISILLGNGDGTFQAPIDNDSFVSPSWLALGDFNNDHNLDIAAVGSFGSSGRIGVLLGNGDGTLQAGLIQPLPGVANSVTAADLNGDGDLDVVIGNLFAEGLTVLLGEGDGSFRDPQTYAGGGYGPVMIRDFHGDGHLDLVSTATAVQGVAEFLGHGDGTFEAAEIYASSGGSVVAAGDLNGDSKPDLVLQGSGASERFSSMLNTGALSFSPSSPLSFPSQLVGTTSDPEVVRLMNTSDRAVSISSIRASGNFRVSNTCGGSVAPGASCTVSAAFAPRSQGRHTGAVTLIDGASSKPQVIELSGTTTVVKLAPESVQFGKQKVGTQSGPLVVAVTNEGSAAITFSSITIGGTDGKDFSQSNDCLSGAIAPGGGCSASVTFTPGKSGSRTGTLYFDLRGGSSPRPVMLAGDGD